MMYPLPHLYNRNTQVCILSSAQPLAYNFAFSGFVPTLCAGFTSGS